MGHEFKGFLQIIRKRLWIICAIVALTCAATAYVSYYVIPPEYAASAKLFVNKSSVQEGGEGRLEVNSIQANILIINTYKELIRTPAIMDKVAGQYPELGLTADQLIGIVKVNSIPSTQIMTISAQAFSYEQAVKIVNSVSKVFRDEVTKIMAVDNVTILEDANAANNSLPIIPKPKTNIAIALFVSVILSFLLALVLEYFDDTIKSEEEMSQVLGIPTLGVISKVKASEMKESLQTKTNQKVVGETAYAGINR